MQERLTLNNFYCKDLTSEYNAIYRTSNEYEEYFKQSFKNYKIVETDLILTKET